jgi:hypothetical protein
MATHNHGFVRALGASHEESVRDYIGPLACSFPIDALSLGSRSRADRTDETVKCKHVEEMKEESTLARNLQSTALPRSSH